jgi:hypothetical protein
MLTTQKYNLTKHNCYRLSSQPLLSWTLPVMLLTYITNSTLAYGDSFTAKRAGQGFTAITQDFTSSLSNPALLTKYNRDDNVFFSFNLGGMGSGQYNVVDIAEDISQNLSTLAADINSGKPNDDLTKQVEMITTDLDNINNKLVNVRNGLNFQLIIPNKYLSVGFFTNQYGRIGGVATYDESDEILLNNAITQGNLDLTQLKSKATGVGYSIAEAGVMLGYKVINHANYELSIGTKIKYQRIDLFYNAQNISEFDEDEFDLNNEEYLTDKNSANIDLGLYLAWGDARQWHIALVSDNLVSQEVKHNEDNITFTLEPTTTLGFSYQTDRLTLATEIDVTDREKFTSLMPSKYAAVGVEYAIFEALTLRLGLRSDLNDVDGDLYTLGFGFSPWEVLSIDVAGFAGNNDTYGAALQLGLRI